MNIQSLVGKKINQTQGFLEDGTRVPLSVISVSQNIISQVKTEAREGYNALQVGFGEAKGASKALNGHAKKAGLNTTPRFFREVRVDDVADAASGTVIAIAEVFEPGDIVDVVGTSKGKGYAGVVKRHGFHGGPKTHGQSDRHRAPGASGQGTTPGRVYRGKRMSGRMGNERVTVKNLEILDVQGDTLLVKGLIPGAKGAVVMVTKVGKNKKFMPLWAEKLEETVEAQAVDEAPVEAKDEKVETAEEVVKTPEESVETPEESVETVDTSVKTSEESVKAEGEKPNEEAAEAEAKDGQKQEESGEVK